MKKYHLQPKENYIKVVRRPYPLLLTSLYSEGMAITENCTYFLPNWRAVDGLAIVGGADVYYLKRDATELGQIMFDSWQDRKVFYESVKKFEMQEDVLLKSVNTTYEEFTREWEKYTPALYVPFIEDAISSRLKELLAKKVSGEEVEHILDLLNIPLKDNIYKTEMYELAQTDDVEAHVAKYGFIGVRYGSRLGYTVEQALEKKGQLNFELLKKETQEEKEKVEENLERAKELLGKDAVLADVMQWAVYYRTQRTDILSRALFEAYDLFVKKGQEFGLSYDQLLLCSQTEVMTGDIPSQEVRESRQEQYTFVSEGLRGYIYHGEDNKNIVDYFAGNLGDVTEFSGQTAAKGNVKGPVKVVHTKEDLNTVCDGDILVTSMTTPDMVAAMGRAQAFVTDEGGITCHAAIMSRELKKPCIIGTKIATKVLKDGDMVEVDAEKGIVRKI